MEEAPKKIAFVIDANVVISSLIKPSGATAQILYKLMDLDVPLYVPSVLWKEIEANKDVILKKNVHLVGILNEVLRRAKKFFTTQEVLLTKEALSLVLDEKDAMYVSLALYLRRTYSVVFVLTYNKKDFKVEELKEQNVFVLEPPEVFGRIKDVLEPKNFP